MRRSASLRFGLALALVSTVVILYITFVTLAQGHQSRVESRLPAIVGLARTSSVPLPALMALCVAESHRESVRADAEMASLLAEVLHVLQQAKFLGGYRPVPQAIRQLYPDVIEQNLVLDLWRMNRERWSRLAAQSRDS